MRFVTHALPCFSLRFLMALSLLSLTSAEADVAKPDGDKPGFIGRIFGGGKKETPPPPPSPAEVKEAPKAKPTTPGPTPKVTTTKPKSGSGTASKSTTTPKKSTAATKPAATPAKKTVTIPVTKPTAEPEKKTASAPKDKPESEFDSEKEEEKPAAPKAASTPTPAPEVATRLPSNTGWQIVKIGGRDYITGDSIHQFYRFSTYKVEGQHVWLRSNNLVMKGTIGSQEMLINNIKFILSYPVQESGGKALFSRLDLCKLIDPVLRPTYISDAEVFDTVVIDAGHGGHDAGARGVYGYEKDFALKMAFALKDTLTKRGFKVILTRSTDTFITLSGRVAIANATPNSIFISLHFNSGGSAATGIETFALTPQGSSASLERGGGYNAYGLTGNSHDSANIALATAVHAMVISKFKFVDRGIKRAQWSVLTGCKKPGILFEGGFVTNGTECRLIASDTYRQSVTAAMADAVINYRTALKGAMTRQR